MAKKSLLLSLIFIVFLLSGFSGCYEKKDLENPSANTDLENPSQERFKESFSKTEENAVVIDNFAFEPDELIIDAGTEVIWKQNDDVAHTIVSEGLIKSEILNKGDEFSFTFSEKGEYGYSCGIHPSMKGKVIVR